MSAEELRRFLRDRGAESVTHPGGTLYAHLNRVHDRLLDLGVSGRVALAGLGHAVYGTDGFDMRLAELSERDAVGAIVGADVEAHIYRYGACDRAKTWSALATRRAIWDRFTGRALDAQAGPLTAAGLSAFADITIVNEVDVSEQDTTIRQQWSGYFRTTFAAWRGIASDRVLNDAINSLRSGGNDEADRSEMVAMTRSSATEPGRYALTLMVRRSAYFAGNPSRRENVVIVGVS